MVNETAGAGKARRLWSRLRDGLTGPTCDWASTRRPGHARELARDAASRGYDLVVAFGGDGTVHEVVNGIMREERAEAALGIVPAGTGNDIARSFGVPSDPAEACRVLREKPVLRRMDLARVKDRYFVGVGGAGFDAEVAALCNRWPKYLPGTITYVLGIFALLATFNPVEVELALDGEVLRQRILLVALGNTQYYGGGMRMCPLARPDDGLLEVVVAGPLGKLETIRLLPTLFKGRHILHRLVSCYRAREVSIRSATPLSLQADGEVLGQLPATFRVLPGALPVVAGEPLAPLNLEGVNPAVPGSG